MDTSTLDILNNDPWLLTLPAEARAELIAAATIKRFEENHVLYRKGDDPCSLMCVLSGRVRAEATTLSGDQLMFTSMLAGEWFGEISILDGLGRSHDAVTVEKSVMVLIPMGVVIKLIEQDTRVYKALVEMLCKHLRQALMLVDTFLLFTPEQRLATRLLKANQNLAPLSEIKVNQDELSKLVGISRQSINKILKKWESDNWISLAYSSITIEDEAQLIKLAEL